MRCMSCGADIPPEFVHSLEINQCAGCGGPIYNEDTKNLLTELTEAMQKMPNDPQGVAGWLLSNYRFQKMGEGKPVDKFYRKGGQGPDDGNLKTDPSYSEFIKRNNAVGLVARGQELAEKVKSAKNGKFAELAEMIQEGAGDPYGESTETETTVSPDEQKAYLELKASGFDPFSPKQGITDLSQAIRPQDVVDLMNQGSDAPSKVEVELSQTEEGRRYLERDRHKRLKAQNAISGAGGSFRR